jgi:hypothetical protein
MKPTSLKSKKCKGCGDSFIPRTGLQVVCGVPCSIKYTRIMMERKRAKDDAKRLRVGRERLRNKSDYLKSAQISVNAYIRARDAGRPCVSCDKPDDGTHQRHASHYRSVAACSQLRFNTKNIWASCRVCNEILSGNLLEFRQRLEQSHPGLPEWLESQNEITRYNVEYLKRLKKIFDKRIRHVKRRNLKLYKAG